MTKIDYLAGHIPHIKYREDCKLMFWGGCISFVVYLIFSIYFIFVKIFDFLENNLTSEN